MLTSIVCVACHACPSPGNFFHFDTQTHMHASCLKESTCLRRADFFGSFVSMAALHSLSEKSWQAWRKTLAQLRQWKKSWTLQVLSQWKCKSRSGKSSVVLFLIFSLYIPFILLFFFLLSFSIFCCCFTMNITYMWSVGGNSKHTMLEICLDRRLFLSLFVKRNFCTVNKLELTHWLLRIILGQDAVYGLQYA